MFDVRMDRLEVIPLVSRPRTRHGTTRASEGRGSLRGGRGVLMGPNTLARHSDLELGLTQEILAA